jgi:tetratricopeptide (TPR) repeat protein
LRLYEKADKLLQQERFDDMQTILNDLHQNINQELEWKIYIEAAQMFERTGMLKKAVGFVTNSVLSCPDNIKWKIWLLASRLLMRMGEASQSREVIERSCFETPIK